MDILYNDFSFDDYCFLGFVEMTEQFPIHNGKSQGKWVPCPTCRQCTDLENIAYVDDKQNNACGCGMPPKFQGPHASEISLHVKGSYGTKVCYLLFILSIIMNNTFYKREWIDRLQISFYYLSKLNSMCASGWKFHSWFWNFLSAKFYVIHFTNFLDFFASLGDNFASRFVPNALDDKEWEKLIYANNLWNH